MLAEVGALQGIHMEMMLAHRKSSFSNLTSVSTAMIQSTNHILFSTAQAGFLHPTTGSHAVKSKENTRHGVAPLHPTHVCSSTAHHLTC